MTTIVPTPEFDESLLTTRTVLFEFSGQFDLDVLARTLPITPIVFERPRKRGTKPKVKLFPPFGKIYAVRYGNVSRGVYGPAFKNSVMIDFSVGTKSVNVKVSKKSIHICGIRLATEGLELAQRIVHYTQRAHAFLQDLNALPTKDAFLEDVATRTCGPIGSIPKYVFVNEIHKGKTKLRRQEDGTVEKPTAIPLTESTHAPHHLVLWISELLSGLQSHAEVLDVIAWLRTSPVLLESELVLDPSPHHVMINCSYSLGFPIKKDVFKTLCDQRTDFYAHYNNAVDFYVNVVLKCSDEDMAEHRVLVSKKKKMAFHTFIVYDSGHVMQSSKVYESMRDAFYRFREMIEEMRPQIEDTEAVAARLVRKNSSGVS